MKPISQGMDLSVVIVSWNASAYLRDCLESIRRTRGRRRIEVIVVDNASSDGSPEMVSTEFPDVVLLSNPTNEGFAAANNTGIQRSSGRYLALVNSDVSILPGCLDSLVDFMEANPGIGLSGPRILNSDGTLQSSCRRAPTLWNTFCDATGLARLASLSRLLAGQHMTYFEHDVVQEVDVLVGCFWVIRRSALEAVGLLDSAFFMYAEDLDWCARCWAAGWRVVFTPVGQAVHHRAGSSMNDPVRFAVQQQKAVFQYWRKHRNRLSCSILKSMMFLRHFSRYLGGLLLPLLGAEQVVPGVNVRASLECMRETITTQGALGSDK